MKANMGYVVFLAVVAALGGFLFGYDTAVISGTIEAVDNQRKKLTVSVKIFGRKTPMELSFMQVEKE